MPFEEVQQLHELAKEFFALPMSEKDVSSLMHILYDL